VLPAGVPPAAIKSYFRPDLGCTPVTIVPNDWLATRTFHVLEDLMDFPFVGPFTLR
jgi:hypothetical protein